MNFQPHEQDIDWDIEARHLDEAEFYFQAWQDAHGAPNYTLAEIAAGPERRLLEHVDALQIGGPVVFERLLAPTIEDDDADHERIAAAVLGGSQPPPPVGVLAAAVAPEQQLGIIRALQSNADPNLDATLTTALGSARNTSFAALLELLALRRVPVDASLRQYLRSDEPAIVRAAAKLARYCSDPSVLADVAALARADDAELRCTVVETALLRNLPGAWESALYWAFDPTSDMRRVALTWVALLGDAAVHARLLDMLDKRELRQDLLWVAGFTGRVSAVDRCIERLDDEQLGPLAAEAIGAITGLPIEDQPFAKHPAQPHDEAAQSLPELHRDLAANLVPTPESVLVYPEPEPISRWWQANRDRFDPTRRYLGGELLTSRVLVDALWHAPARRRHLLARELELRTGGAAAVDTHQFHHAQARQLDHLPELDQVDFQRGFPLR